MQKKGICFRSLVEGGTMMEINSFSNYFNTALQTVLMMTKRVHHKVLQMQIKSASKVLHERYMHLHMCILCKTFDVSFLD